MRFPDKRLIILIFLIILIVKFSLAPLDYEKFTDNNNNDLSEYIKCRNDIIGVNNPSNAHTVPPLYPMLLIPAVNDFYVYSLNIILASLITVSLFILAYQYLNQKQSFIIALIIGVFHFWFGVQSFGYPILLASLLVTWFFICFNYIKLSKYNNYFYASAILLGLLFLTKYIFIYFLPFVLFYIFLLEPYKLKEKIKMFSIILIISGAILSIWLLRNGLLYGFTNLGLFGGYKNTPIETVTASATYGTASEITIISKLLSFREYIQVYIYYVYVLFFSISFIISYLFKTIHNKLQFYLFAVSINIGIYFMIGLLFFERGEPAFYYRYSIYFTPFLLCMGFILWFFFKNKISSITYN